VKYVPLALPLLMGSSPPPCRPPFAGDVEVVATVTAVKRPVYSCQVTPSPHAAGCVGVFSGDTECELTLHVSDGTSRSGTYQRGLGQSWCDVPLGRHRIALCTPTGSLPCEIELRPGAAAVDLGVRRSQPLAYRYHVHTASPVAGLGTSELTLDSDGVILAAGDQRRILLRGQNLAARVHQRGLTIDACDVAPVQPVTAAVPPRGGCAHCGVGDIDPASLGLGLIVLATCLRRKSR